MDVKKKINDLLTGKFKNKGKKKLIENAVIIIIIGVIIIIAGGTFFNSGAENKNGTNVKTTETADKTGTLTEAAANVTQKELEYILSRIKGVGKVNVMITFASTSENVPAYETEKNNNTTEEKDSGGGTRTVNDSVYKDTIVFEELPGGGKKPVMVKTTLPEVKGVVVAADGAADPVVKESICLAVQALLDVPIYKVQVFERE